MNTVEHNVNSSKKDTNDMKMSNDKVDIDVHPSSSKLISSGVKDTNINLEKGVAKDILEKKEIYSNKVSTDTTITNNMFETNVNCSSSKMISSEVEGTVVIMTSNLPKERIENKLKRF